jgi:hypothetical protein
MTVCFLSFSGPFNPSPIDHGGQHCMNPTHACTGKADPQVTQRSTSRRVAASSLAACALGSVFSLGSVAFAQDQPVIPDAQVQANVLKALAGAPELAAEDIHTRTVFGVVSLTGRVSTEAMQVRAENLAANSPGVKKVVDEMVVGSTATAASAVTSSADGPRTNSAGTTGQHVEVQRTAGSAAAGGDPAPGSAPASSAVMNDPERDQQAGYGSASNSPADAGPGNEGAPGSRRFPDLGPQDREARADRSGYEQIQAPLRGGQEAGKRVIIPSDTILRVRLDGTVSSNRSQAGSSFDGVMMSDVVADGAVAIPRGAQVHGTVTSATRAGILKGRGDLSLVLTSVTLGGQLYPLVTMAWEHHGGDKTIETLNKTAGFGAVGAVIGALAGGGAGAAVGGGIGAAAGLGSSATSGRGQVYLPAESVVTFRLAEAAAVTTVSQQEMQRLAYGSAPNLQPRYPRQHSYPDIYFGPSIYPGYYPGYYPRPYPGYYPPPYGYPPYY